MGLSGDSQPKIKSSQQIGAPLSLKTPHTLPKLGTRRDHVRKISLFAFVLVLAAALFFWLPPTQAQNPTTPIIVPLSSQIFDLRWQGDDFWTVTTNYPAKDSLIFSQWDGATGELKVEYAYPTNPYSTGFAWSHDMQEVVIFNETTLSLHTPATQEIIWTTQSPVDDVQWSRDDSRLLIQTYDRNLLYVVDKTTNEAIFTIMPPSIGRLKVARWSPDETRILGLTYDAANWLSVWDASTGDVILEQDFTTPNGESIMEDAQWNGDGSRILVIGGDFPLLDATTGETLLSYPGGTFSYAWSPDRMRVMILDPAMGDSPVWDTESGTVAFTINRESDSDNWNNVLWSPDGGHIGAWGPLSLTLFDAGTGAGLESIPKTEWGLAPFFEWSPNGQFIGVQGETTQLMLVDATSGTLLNILAESSGGAPVIGPVAIAWSPDGNKILGYGGSGTAIWDAPSGELLADYPATLSQPAEGLVGVAEIVWHPDSQRVLVNVASFYCAEDTCPNDIQVWTIE